MCFYQWMCFNCLNSDVYLQVEVGLISQYKYKMQDLFHKHAETLRNIL